MDLKTSRLLDGKRILIVDDDPLLVESLCAALSPPYLVSAASTPQGALAFLEAEHTDVIILDLVLGDEDGLVLLPRLRERTAAPILMLTGYGTRENLLRAIRAKPDDFLAKPVHLQTLRSRVASLLEKAAPSADPLERVRAWIAREFIRPPTAEQLARVAGMSVDHLRKEFAKRYRVTPRAYVEQCRMIQAATLLRETDSLIKDVGWQVGFDNPNNFCTAFKRFHSTSPEAFRAQHRLSPPPMTTPPPPRLMSEFQR